jgi:methyltransferase (TIGR00027 family)
MTDTLIGNVSDTAFWIAHYRALESQRADALFHDPLAGVLAGDRGKQIARGMPRAFMTAWFIVIRTCIIDDYLRFAIAQGADIVLNLGAGLDTRPYRMDLPSSLLWVEADYPDIIDLKQKRLSREAPRCRLERVKLDLACLPERRQLFASVNARGKKMVVLTEGVIPYLNVEAVGSLADDLRALDHACYWIVDYMAPAIIQHRQRLMKTKMQNAPFQFKPGDWFGLFRGHGWHLREIRYLSEEGERRHRPIRVPLPYKLTMGIQRLFISKKRRETFRKFAGYAILEPGSRQQQK